MPAAVVGDDVVVGVLPLEGAGEAERKGVSLPLPQPAGLGSGLDTTLISTSASEEDIWFG